MKKYFQYCLLLLFLSCLILTSCQQEEPIFELPQVAPAVIDLALIKDIHLYKDENSILPEPTVEFHYPLGIESRLYGDRKNYRLILDAYSIEYNERKISEKEHIVYAEDSLSVKLKMHDLIESEAEVKITVKVIWEVWAWDDEKEKGKGAWEKVIWENEVLGQELAQHFQARFKEDKFHQENIHAAYPIPNQYHFHKGEYPKGYLKLYHNQSFSNGLSGLAVRISNSQKGYEKEIAPTYNREEKILSFDMPQDLEKETIYELEYLLKEDLKENVLYKYHFRTSKYDRFEEKIAALEAGFVRDLTWTISVMVEEIYKAYQVEELFDQHERRLEKRRFWSDEPNANVQTGLVRLEALLSENLHYTERIYPLTYESFEGTGFEPNWRSVEAYGLPPKEAMYIRQNNQEAFELTQDQISSHSAASKGGSMHLVYNLAPAYSADFAVMRNQVYNHIARNYENQDDAPTRLKRISEARFPPLGRGDYQFKISYLLPGINEVSFEQEMVVRR